MPDLPTKIRPGKIMMIACLGVSFGLHVLLLLSVAYLLKNPAFITVMPYPEPGELHVTAPERPVLSMQTQRNASPPLENKHVTSEERGSEAPDSPQAVPHIQQGMKDVLSTPLGLGMTYGFVSSLADGTTLKEEIREYYLMLVDKINQNWWERAGVLAGAVTQDGIFDIMIQRDGTLLDMRIRKGTGSKEADRALIDAIRKAAPMPALPESFAQEVFIAPLKIAAPSNLFRIRPLH